ncbi:MAG: circularly permuted type 2 ATP-grasp protein [Akkermansiaceae bacterium]|nr:circularly permuted type 2 ATP-grasp protein [Akkermansiaceae bacterium]
MLQRSRSVPANTPPSTGGAGDAAWDEMTAPDGGIRPGWEDFAGKLQAMTSADRANLSATADRMLDDLGTTFNVYSDVGGTGQPYVIDPLPLMVRREEWDKISAGLIQRMRLLEMVVADLYGPQKLMAEGLIPPDLIHSNRSYQPQIRGVQPQGGKFLVGFSSDLVRMPGGIWKVLNDQVQGAQGLGQVLENRSVASNVLSDAYESARVARLQPFFDAERATLQELSMPRGEMPNVVFLTAGFRHPSYFEHAYKARLLGFPLVEAADLTVREKRLYLKTLGGLRRIDCVANRLGDDVIDPLDFWTMGRGGVPGIVEAWRSGNLALANAPGAGLASSPALLPFLPQICRKWLGEDLKLPFVETWWLGQADVRAKVLENFSRYVLLSASLDEPLLPVRWSSLSPNARKHWLTIIEERPYDFVAQLDVTPSVAPSLDGRSLASRPVVVRGFTLNSSGTPVTLPGGLGRVGKPGQAPQLWPVHAGSTKDVWILEGAEEPGKAKAGKPESPTMVRRHPAAAEVPSRIAEELFWVGRYAERIELATRLLRVTMKHLVGEAGRLQHEQLAACLDLLDAVGMAPAKKKTKAFGLLGALIDQVHGTNSGTGIPPLVRALLSNAAAARDRLSDDTWRFFNRLDGIIHPPPTPPQARELSVTLDQLILHLSAFAGMQAENMTRGQGWRFLEVGRRLERALGTLVLLQVAAAGEKDEEDSHFLEPVLEICDSVMTYRRRHFSKPRWDAVCELLFMDQTNPRSVAHQTAILQTESGNFPGDPNSGLFPQIVARLALLDEPFGKSGPRTTEELEVFSGRLEDLSDLLTQHYFSHSVRRVY